jgi:hypothetical protein
MAPLNTYSIAECHCKINQIFILFITWIMCIIGPTEIGWKYSSSSSFMKLLKYQQLNESIQMTVNKKTYLIDGNQIVTCLAVIMNTVLFWWKARIQSLNNVHTDLRILRINYPSFPQLVQPHSITLLLLPASVQALPIFSLQFPGWHNFCPVTWCIILNE